MAIIHTPRVIASLGKGLLKQSELQNKGVGIIKPHKYYARVGIFDVDYLGHMNNAAYLSHAEYARWEMTASNGMLQAMYKHNTHFVVASASCRYRAEIRPLFQRFEIHSMVSGMDDKSLWIYQSFRNSKEGDGRVRAQVLVKGVTLKDRKVVSPKDFFIEKVGLDRHLIHSLERPSANMTMEEMIVHFENLENTYREVASFEDEASMPK